MPSPGVSERARAWFSGLFPNWQRREGSFSSAAKACKQVRHDPSGHDDEIRFDNTAIEFNWGSMRRGPHKDKVFPVVTVVLVKADPAGDFFSDDSYVLIRGLGSVRTLGKNDGNILIGDACLIEFVDQGPHEIP